ncbi:MAG TPA: DUF4118 domain-containing protein [Planctomycetota bacterium]|nr:DUF4118 domain-containing protein [Planctomycetota bacterium]
MSSGGQSRAQAATSLAAPRGGTKPTGWRPYAKAFAIMAVCTGVSEFLHAPFDLGNVVAVYLLGVMLAAAWLGRRPAVFASLLGALAVDFLFLPPLYGFLPEQAAHLLTFSVMLAVAATVGTLAARLREQLQKAQEREHNTATLYGLARDLARAADADAVVHAVDHHVRARFGCRAVLLTCTAGGALQGVGAAAPALDDRELDAARAAMAPAHDTPPVPARGRYQAMTTGKGTLGVLGLLPEAEGAPAVEPPHGYLEAFANQTAIALERTMLADAAGRAALAVEHERLRNTLLSSVSHDLRTPIASIIGASSALLREQTLDAHTRRELLESIHQEGGRLERQVRNLLDMTRLEAGTVQARLDWTPVEDVVGAVLTRLEDGLRDRELITHIEAELPPVPMDGMLIEQVLLNLLENALRHTPPGTPLELAARAVGTGVQIEVADRGPGLAANAFERVFEKFHGTARSGGFGLGLAICRAIASLHGGSVVAANRPGGGAVFTLTLPLVPPPSLPPLVRTSRGAS